MYPNYWYKKFSLRLQHWLLTYSYLKCWNENPKLFFKRIILFWAFQKVLTAYLIRFTRSYTSCFKNSGMYIAFYLIYSKCFCVQFFEDTHLETSSNIKSFMKNLINFVETGHRRVFDFIEWILPFLIIPILTGVFLVVSKVQSSLFIICPRIFRSNEIYLIKIKFDL